MRDAPTQPPAGWLTSLILLPGFEVGLGSWLIQSFPPRYLPKNCSKLMLTCTLFKIIERFVNISIKIELLALRQNERLFQKLSP